MLSSMSPCRDVCSTLRSSSFFCMSTLWSKVVDSDGDTPLMIAAHEGNVEAREGQSFVRDAPERLKVSQFFWNMLIGRPGIVCQLYRAKGSCYQIVWWYARGFPR